MLSVKKILVATSAILLSGVSHAQLLGSSASLQQTSFCKNYGCVVTGKRIGEWPYGKTTIYNIALKKSDVTIEFTRNEGGVGIGGEMYMTSDPLRDRDYPLIYSFLKTIMGGEYSRAQIDKCLSDVFHNRAEGDTEGLLGSYKYLGAKCAYERGPGGGKLAVLRGFVPI